jgi:hypothetical protein
MRQEYLLIAYYILLPKYANYLVPEKLKFSNFRVFGSFFLQKREDRVTFAM